MKPSALCTLLFLVFSLFCQAAEPNKSSDLKAAKLEQLKTLQTGLAAATQEQNFAEVKRITAELNKVVSELEGMKSSAPANPPAPAPVAAAEKAAPTGTTNAATMKPAKIRVIEVSGSGARAINAQGASSELKRGDFLSQGVRIVTGPEASVELAFENGSSVVVKPGTEFSIDQFLAAPFDSEAIDYGSLENEPTMSVTRTNLKSGEIFFHVEKLKERSTYEIITPVGIAGIRGTGGFARSGKGKGAFGLYEGAAIFKTPNGQVHSVRQGQAIAIGDAETKYAVTGNPPKSAEILAAAKEKMGEVEEQTPAHPFEDKPLPVKEEKKGDASGIPASAYEYQGPVVTTLANLGGAKGIAVDGRGDVYVADAGGNRILKINSIGTITTIAGSGKPGAADGHGTKASFFGPTGISVDRIGNIYVGDWNNNGIRKIDATRKVVTLAGAGKKAYADGRGAEAGFNWPEGVAVDETGNVYVADAGNSRIRKIDDSGRVTTLAGSGRHAYADGDGIRAMFSAPIGLALDKIGNVYVTDRSNNRIRKIDANGRVTTLAGSGGSGYADGQGIEASFNAPNGIAVDGIGNVYVADTGNDRIRKITPSGAVTTIAGSGNKGSEDGYGVAASFNHPWGIAVDVGGIIYVTDYGNNKIRKISQ